MLSRIRAVLAALLVSVTASTPPVRAQVPDDRLRVQIVTDEAEAALEILEARARRTVPEPAAWKRLHESEGYRRLKEREAAMRVPFTDEEFRTFLMQDTLPTREPVLRRTLRAWTSADPDAAARRAFAYLPAGAVIDARIYPVIKPKRNSFVYDLAGDPAIFLYLDPETSGAEFENTMAHELHHIGFAATCKAPPTDELPAGARRARDWASAFGEGLAMLAAAGGPDVHPHASSPPELRTVWNRDVANVPRDMRRIESFLLDLVDERLTEDEDVRRRGFELIVSEEVPQGPFYTVGWHVAATIERGLARSELVASICDPADFLAAYNRAVSSSKSETDHWAPRLIEALSVP